MRTADPALRHRRAEEIAAAATRAFLARGFHQTSMGDVAREAGVSMGLLYRYYSGKAALIAAAAALDRGDQARQAEALAQAADPVAALIAWGLDIVEEARRPGYVDLLAEIAAEACRNAKVAAVLRDDQRDHRAMLGRALSDQRERGRLNHEDPALAAELWLSLIDGLMMRARLEPDIDLTATVQAAAERLLGARQSG